MIVESRLECVGCKANVGLYMVVFTIGYCGLVDD